MKRLHRVTGHCLERLAERSSAPADPITVRLDVAAAIREGRVAKAAPRWVGDEFGRSRVRGPGTKRFVWNAARSRCYVIRRQDGGWQVLTVLGRREEAAAA